MSRAGTIGATVDDSISQRAASIRPSATFAMAARAATLRAEGREIHDFSAGEPDFRPPTAVREATAAFVRDQPVRYTPVAGMPALREAVATHLSEVHGSAITPSRVLISCGAKHSIANFLQALLEPGDEVVIPTPAWVSYPDMVRLAGGVPVEIATTRADGFRLRPEALEAALTPRTRALVLNSPGNPTGAGYDAARVRALGEVVAHRAPRAWIMADDIYRRLTYGEFRHASIVRTLADLHPRLAIVDGVSKTYAMTGYRIGYLVASEALVLGATRVQGQTTSGAATPSQHAALAALTDPSVDPEVDAMCVAFARRRDLMLARLAAIPDVHVPVPDGAFYVWMDVGAYLGRDPAPDDAALSRWLLEQHGVATVPGGAFGGPGHIRLSYATADAVIEAGCERLASAMAALRRA